jgi:hypothetical protein
MHLITLYQLFLYAHFMMLLSLITALVNHHKDLSLEQL